MKRLENGEGSSPLISIRLQQKTTELLDALVANLPPHPVAGPQPRSMVLRAVIDAGIEAIAVREGIKGIKVGSAAPKPVARKAPRRRVLQGHEFDDVRRASAKTSDGKPVHPRSRARAEKRAAARRAAGCTCKSRHVPPCKLYRQPSAA